MAISLGVHDHRVAAVAAPVLVEGAVIGSVSVLAPRHEMRDDVLESVTTKVIAAAAKYD